MGYGSRKFLAKKTDSITSSCVAFHGHYNDKPWSFFEIADCHNKVAIHLGGDESIKSYTKRLKVLQRELSLFINHLEQQ